MQLELLAHAPIPVPMRPANLILALLLGLALAAGIWVALSVNQPAGQASVDADASTSTATILPTVMEVPAVSLVDQTGRDIDQSVFEGQWDVVFFGFATCPDICPITLRVLRDAQLELEQNGADTLPRIVLVSVDPERDTPEVLTEYMKGFGDNSIAVTGELEQLRTLTSALGIFFDKRYVDEEFYTVDHSSVVLVIDPEGQVTALFSSPHRAENYVNDLPIVTRS